MNSQLQKYSFDLELIPSDYYNPKDTSQTDELSANNMHQSFDKSLNNDSDVSTKQSYNNINSLQSDDKDTLTLDEKQSQKFKKQVLTQKQQQKQQLISNLDQDITNINSNESEDLKKQQKKIIKKLIAKDSKQNNLKCNQCQFTTTKARYLTAHQAYVHSQSEIKCDHCDFVTKCKRYLRKHVKKMHNSSTIYNCDICDFTTTVNLTLYRHKVKEHQIRKEYEIFECDNCDYTSMNKAEYKLHINTHNSNSQQQNVNLSNQSNKTEYHSKNPIPQNQYC